MPDLQVTLSSAAAAAFVNLWLAIRVGAIRRAAGIDVGDGGSEPLQRRMRAQANYVENTPFVLVLIAAIELSGRGGDWLVWIAAAYFIARIAHGFGMDGGAAQIGRMIGTLITMIVLAGLAIVAVLISARML